MNRRRRIIVTGAGSATVINGGVIASEFFGWGSYQLAALGGIALALIAATVTAFLGLNASVRGVARSIASALLIYSLVSFGLIRLSFEARTYAFDRLAVRSETLIDAIRKFETDQGRPPTSLTELAPKYVTAVPQTGLLAYPEYEYELLGSDNATRLYWYDLGSRNANPFEGLWVYPDGDPDHAILVFEVSQDNIVTSARFDRLPSDLGVLPLKGRQVFERVTANAALVRGDVDNVFKELGKPDGTRALRDTTWELRVPCSTGVLNWDVFFYWPSETYPEYIYGGTVERIRNWAYVHE